MHDAQVVVRTADPSEYPALSRLTVEAYSEYAEELGAERWKGYSESLGDIEGKSKDALILAAEKDRHLVGSLALYRLLPEDRPWPKEWAFLRAMAVDPKHRRAGIGRALIMESIKVAREWGSPALFLRSTKMMKAALELYDQLGFIRVPEYEEEVRPGFWVTSHLYRLD